MLLLASNHWNFGLIFINIGFLILFFQTFKSDLFLENIHYTDWNSGPILANIGILILSFQTLEFWPYPSIHWNSDVSF